MGDGPPFGQTRSKSVRRAHLLAPRGVAAGGGGLRGGRGRARVAWPAGRPLRERWPGTPAMSLPDGKRLRSAVNHVAEMSHIIAAKWAVGNKLLNTYSNNFANEEEQEVRVRAAPRRAAEEPGRARRGSGRSGARAGTGPRLSADSAGAAGPASPMPSRLEQLKGRADTCALRRARGPRDRDRARGPRAARPLRIPAAQLLGASEASRSLVQKSRVLPTRRPSQGTFRQAPGRRVGTRARTGGQTPARWRWTREDCGVSPPPSPPAAGMHAWWA